MTDGAARFHDLEPHEKVDMTKQEVDDLVYLSMSVMAMCAALFTKRFPKWGYRAFLFVGALGALAGILEDDTDA